MHEKQSTFLRKCKKNNKVICKIICHEFWGALSPKKILVRPLSWACRCTASGPASRLRKKRSQSRGLPRRGTNELHTSSSAHIQHRDSLHTRNIHMIYTLSLPNESPFSRRRPNCGASCFLIPARGWMRTEKDRIPRVVSHASHNRVCMARNPSTLFSQRKSQMCGSALTLHNKYLT